MGVRENVMSAVIIHIQRWVWEQFSASLLSRASKNPVLFSF